MTNYLVVSKNVRTFASEIKEIVPRYKLNHTTIMVKLNAEVINNYYNAVANANNVAKEFITAFLKEHNNSVDLLNEETDEYVGDEIISVSYDGGNHPEYASNVFSSVERVYLDEEGYITLDTEDAEGYPIEDCDLNEVIYLAEYLNRVQDLF